jgi:hypothetical protein
LKAATILGSDGAVPNPSNTTVTLETALVAADDKVTVVPEILETVVAADTVLNVKVTLVGMTAVITLSNVIVVEAILAILDPLVIPVPDTVIPTTRPELLATVKLVLPTKDSETLVAMVAVVAVSRVTVLEFTSETVVPLAIPVPDTVIPATRLDASDTLNIVDPVTISAEGLCVTAAISTCAAGLFVVEILTYIPATIPVALPTVKAVAPLLMVPVVDTLVASPLISKIEVPLYELAAFAPSAYIRRSSLVVKLYVSNLYRPALERLESILVHELPVPK